MGSHAPEELSETAKERVSCFSEPILEEVETTGFLERNWEMALKIVMCYCIISGL